MKMFASSQTNPGTIRPFRLETAQAELQDLKQRLSMTRWPDELPSAGWNYGAPLSFVKDMAAYWEHSFDWTKQEQRLNSYPQFTTTIDGANIHFFHIRSSEPGAVPLMLIHGWPSSPVEFLELIGPLTDPTSYGGDAADAFHLVIPSLPGFGLSGPTTDAGWSPSRAA
ncbi:epoxide hydrolase family protein, partial [Paenibacillus sp. AR247]|uniref:epoxide hydrolase family protein n=1 Tax=Paenibacillus sp. AR247 TaxID=1631599 RepID=UPI000D455FF7